MNICPVCQTPFEEGTKFCSKCGANLEEVFIENPVCPICHKVYPSGTQFCATDGSKLVSRDKLKPKCVICGKEYPEGTKYCPDDGGEVVAEALRGTSEYRNMHKATFGERLLAALIDSLIGVVLAIPAFLLYIFAALQIDGGSAAIGFVLILTFLCYLLPVIYYLIKDGLGEGQSYGKRIMKIKVIKVADLSKCTKVDSCIRSVVTLLLNCIPVVGWLIEPIIVILADDGRRLADKAAGTMVVKCE